MSAFSDDLERKLLNSTLRGAAFIQPATIYVALFTSNPTDANVGTEVADSGYARQDAAQGEAIANGWSAPNAEGGGHACTNLKRIHFPPIADAQVTVGWFGLYDAATGGNLLYHGAFTAPKTLEINDVVSVDAGGLKVILR